MFCEIGIGPQCLGTYGFCPRRQVLISLGTHVVAVSADCNTRAELTNAFFFSALFLCVNVLHALMLKNMVQGVPSKLGDVFRMVHQSMLLHCCTFWVVERKELPRVVYLSWPGSSQICLRSGTLFTVGEIWIPLWRINLCASWGCLKEWKGYWKVKTVSFGLCFRVQLFCCVFFWALWCCIGVFLP